ncbi:MAG: hypothetical protein EBU62_15465, partial [Proteobacteria bacterium]|nr:hypothetical protein [Pseudomonadota bacterium]
ATAVASATPVATAVASATAVPATTAPVSSVRTNAIVRTRTIAGGGSQAPCVQASPVEWSQGNNWSSRDASSTDCPASLGLKVTNQSVAGATGTTPYRVGDVIKVDVVARANVATGTYGYATYLDFDTTDYQLVAADGRTPITSGATSGVVSVPDSQLRHASIGSPVHNRPRCRHRPRHLPPARQAQSDDDGPNATG